MKRFLIVLAFVAVAGATYVATAPGGHTAGPTSAQFKALKKQVSKLQSKVSSLSSTVSSLSNTVAVDDGFLADCLVAAGTVPITEYGDPSGTFGYSFSNDASTYFFTSGLDVTAQGDPVDAYVQAVTPDCATNGDLRRKGSLAEHGMVLPSVLHVKH